MSSQQYVLTLMLPTTKEVRSCIPIFFDKAVAIVKIRKIGKDNLYTHNLPKVSDNGAPKTGPNAKPIVCVDNPNIATVVET